MIKAERDQLFQQLLVATQGACHGTRPNYQEDNLWEYQDQLTEDKAQTLLLELSNGHVSMLPYPREFILLWGNDLEIFALYNMSGRDYYLIRTVGTRYHQWLLRNYRDRTPAEREAYLTVQQIYGINKDIHPVARLKRILYPNVQHDTTYHKIIIQTTIPDISINNS